MSWVRWSCYDANYEEPQLDKDYPKPLEEMTEEQELGWDLRTTQIFKAAPAPKTSSWFEDPVINEFTNMMIKEGNKIVARSLMTETLEILRKKRYKKHHAVIAKEWEATEFTSYTIFHQALENCQPVLGLVSTLKGSRFYRVPDPLGDRCPCFLAMKWMVQEHQENKQMLMLENSCITKDLPHLRPCGQEEA
ncbi:28S ribosomal protein S7, mitochondrial-like [Trichosurus vulpecula]|uniref:28S ribosomal protein S7, mitochondrial-like n=1 Tax=Trichosurus vulpecula TaxID=9337 RepID=UPI00186AE63B|nr:28S ribosomal protein S7, mitochondrial-like [Trichosurus vulpecula]